MTFSLTINPADLKRALDACGKVIETNARIPVLRAVHVTAKDGAATFVGTNTDMTVSAIVEAQGDGIAVIDFAMLIAKANAMRPDVDVTMAGDDKTLTIKQGKSQWKIPLDSDVESFPIQLADAIEAALSTLPKEAIAALKAADTNAGVGKMQILQGVNIGNGLVTGSDGHAARQIPVQNTNVAMTLPKRSVQAIAALFDADMELRASNAACSLASKGVVFRTKLMEWQYPDFGPIIERHRFSNRCTVDYADFMKAMERATAIASDKGVTDIKLVFGGDELAILTRNTVQEEGADSVACEREGNEAWNAFSAELLSKTLETMKCDTLDIHYPDEPGHGALFCAHGGDEHNVALVMAKVVMW